MKRHALALTSLAILGGSPAIALAHPLTGSGLTGGLLHPLAGADHLLAMLAIGLWAGQHRGRMQLALPGAFLVALLAGFALAHSPVVLPLVESGIALSVLLLGIVICMGARLPAAAALTLSAVFALFHGYAHGAEASGALMVFAAGFMLTSTLLHLSGIQLARMLARLPLLVRSAGAAIAASGLWMLS